MSKAIVKTKPKNIQEVYEKEYFDDKQLTLIKEIYGKGLLDEEFKHFLYVCVHTRLDPLLKQIYAVKFNGFPMTIITGIDGYRLIAERTRKYCPGRSPTFAYDKNGNLFSATAYVKKLTPDGTWHEVEGFALYSEYVQMVKDKNTQQYVANKTWRERAHGQLAKCAETLALRRAFPNDLSGLRTEEEMGKVLDDAKTINVNEIKEEQKISEEQAQELYKMYNFLDEKFKVKFMKLIKMDPVLADKIENIPASHYQDLHARLFERYNETLDKMSKKSDSQEEITFNPEEFEKDAS